MKPRTKYEMHVTELSDRLPALTKPQQEYAYEHCFQHFVVKRKGMYHCTDCGHSWLPGSKEEQDIDKECGTTCPNCHHHLSIKETRKQSWFERSSFQIVYSVDDVQFVRTFYNRKYYTVGQPAHYWMDEAIRIAIAQGENDVVIARPRAMNGWYCDSYIFSKEMSIKSTRSAYSYYGMDQYYFTAEVVHPRRKVLPILTRNGYSKALYEFGTYRMIHSLLEKPHIETIVKAGRLDILRELTESDIDEVWPQIRLVIRHNYRPTDFIIWRDTVKLAHKLGLDTLSPKYILPDDLNAMHDTLVHRDEQRSLREEREKTLRSNEWYRNFHKALLGVVIVEDGMRITPLQSKEDFVTEGRLMHHCVATYFDRKDSLILCVRNEEGKRLATVELSHKDFSIKQCRAYCNAKPERYDDICSVINRHRIDFVKSAIIK
ncbi:MAG: PcfJ domain-containing protein [Bacteroidales bacterium]|nr:PcfJ domain-containing protein [Bacteroidales bacterium]